MKKLLTIALAAAMMLSVAGCGGSSSSSASAPAPSGSSSSEGTSSSAEAPVPASDFSVAMVTDVGGVNDQSFNQSAWEGLEKFSTDTGSKIKYLESKQEADYGPNLETLADENHNLVWGIGFMLADAIKDAAMKNPDKLYAIVDSNYGAEAPKNTIGVMFKAQEPSFLVGYIAAKTTKTDKVGFVGGMKSSEIDRFDYGFRSGVAYGAKELGKEITVDVQYAESFGDAAKGKAIATKMYNDGIDVVFHAAGNVGTGVIEAAAENKKWVIGVDRDQNYLAPDYVLTSAMKLVGEAAAIVSKDIKDGKDLGGQTLTFGIKEGCAGVAPTSDKNVAPEVLEATKAVEKQIVDGTLVPAYDEATLKTFVDGLNK